MADFSRSSTMKYIVLPCVVVVAKGVCKVAKVVEFMTLHLVTSVPAQQATPNQMLWFPLARKTRSGKEFSALSLPQHVTVLQSCNFDFAPLVECAVAAENVDQEDQKEDDTHYTDEDMLNNVDEEWPPDPLNSMDNTWLLAAPSS
ncbi:hypothetical protein B0H14DRAFT_3479911 [Mycena olivaceomarginata]|nr:hypothetical protein B0H14DRAFT_3479911 [Mycena olivaceomarginata]